MREFCRAPPATAPATPEPPVARSDEPRRARGTRRALATLPNKKSRALFSFILISAAGGPAPVMGFGASGLTLRSGWEPSWRHASPLSAATFSDTPIPHKRTGEPGYNEAMLNFVEDKTQSGNSMFGSYSELGIDGLMEQKYRVHLLAYYMEVRTNLTSSLGRKPTVDEWPSCLNMAVRVPTLSRADNARGARGSALFCV